MRSRAFRAAMLVGALWLLTDSWVGAQDAALQRDINEAIDHGVAYLRHSQAKDGTWPHPLEREKFGPSIIGVTALAGLTLLESGVPATDPAIQKATKVLREQCISLKYNYGVSAAIMFFDRLDDPADEPLIESLALRLMAAQSTWGGWEYFCPEPPPVEIERLKQHYKQVESNKNPREPRKAARKPGDPSQLAPEIRLQLANLRLTNNNQGDNSNTQFALLALWVARRHGLPVDRSLALVEARFRKTQHPIGCWYYLYGPEGVSPETIRERFGSVSSMTCAGLLALAVGNQAVSNKGSKKGAAKELTKDPQVKAALAAVAAFIDNPQADKSKVIILDKNSTQEKAYYFLWTLERMAVVYGLKTIGNKDWYSWGAQILVVNQQGDGSWQGDVQRHGIADSCFALLFLKRANVAQDLADSLKGKVKDAGRASPQLLLMIGKEDVSPSKPPSAKQDTAPKTEPPPAVTAPKGVTAEAAKLADEVVDAAPAEQDALLQKLRDTPGPTYTQALAGAIAKLRGTAKTRARLALAQRLQKLDAEVLRVNLRSTDVEMRRAAAVASGAKKARELVPDLINLLEDGETTVLQAAHAALRQITDQDFGPELDATPAERASAVEAWRKWWKQQG